MISTICRLVGVLVIATIAQGCGGKYGPRKYDTPSVDKLVDHTRQVNAKARSYRATSKMDYWVGGQRVKGTVMLQGRVGAFMRFNALNPATSNVAVDLACNGRGFKYVNTNQNCQLTGPCDKHSIGQLLQVRLMPDDFLLLVIGSTPLIADPTGKVRWDSKKGREIVELVSGDGTLTQKIVLDGRSGNKWAVLSSTVRDASGKIEWRLTNKDFATVKGEDGAEFRVPKKTRFEQPKLKADLIVEWRKRELNLEIPDEGFELEITPGIPTCGRQAQKPQVNSKP